MPQLRKRYRLICHRPEEWVEDQKGKLLLPEHAGKIIPASWGDVDVFRPDGSLLLSYCPQAIDPELSAAALPDLLRVARYSEHRGGNSGLAGYFDYPSPAVTAFTRAEREAWLRILPYLAELDRIYRQACPVPYAVQRRAALASHPYWLIPGTVATTLTVNLNWQSPVHRDKANLPGAFAVLAVIRRGEYSGGELVFPKWALGFDLGDGDVLVADSGLEYHGNLPLVGEDYTRLAMVLYFRAGLRYAPPPG